MSATSQQKVADNGFANMKAVRCEGLDRPCRQHRHRSPHTIQRSAKRWSVARMLVASNLQRLNPRLSHCRWILYDGYVSGRKLDPWSKCREDLASNGHSKLRCVLRIGGEARRGTMMDGFGLVVGDGSRAGKRRKRDSGRVDGRVSKLQEGQRKLDTSRVVVHAFCAAGR